MSAIVEFFTDKAVFLTGGTGFVGKLAIDRLIRVCKVKVIYMLVRPKKGKSEDDRFADIFGMEVFDKLRAECPDYRRHMRLVIGNCVGRNLDISDADWQTLHAEVQVVIHCAATVRFDQDLRTAYNINVRAPRDLLIQARSMKKLQSFIHVSTAYSNCQRKVIEEVVYEPPMTEEQLSVLLSTFPDDEYIKKLEPSILGDIPNTYTYTKCVAEEMMERLAKDPEHPVPLAIVRPSIILSTYKEPFPGWIDNVYGPLGVLISVAVGLMRTLHCRAKNKADMVPADYVINALLAVAYDTSRRGKDHGTEIINYTSCQHSIDWATYMHHTLEYGQNMLPIVAMWRPMLFLNRYLFMHNVCWLLLHTIPAYIVDGVLRLLGRKPMLMDGYSKLGKFTGVISHFAMREWHIPHDKILALYARLNPVDQQLFELRMSTFKFEEFVKDYLKGGRMYILKEPMSNIPAAMKRYRKILAAYYTCNAVLIAIGCWTLNWILSFFSCNLF